MRKLWKNLPYLIAAILPLLALSWGITSLTPEQAKQPIRTSGSGWESNFEWRDESDKDAYTGVVWHSVTVARLEGLSLTQAATGKRMTPLITEGYSGGCNWSDKECRAELVARGVIQDESSYLRVEGGIGRVYYYLQIQNGDTLGVVNSSSSLRKFFAPVDDESEAMSFIAVTQTDLRTPDQTASIPEGYLVRAVKKSTFGCTSHTPYSVIYKVTKDGIISIVASEKRKPESRNGSYICVD